MAVLKTPAQIELIRAAGRIAADILHKVGARVAVGVSTYELDAYAAELMRDAGVISATKGYRGYPASICTSVNEVVCHGIPNHRTLQAGDIVNVDVTVIKDGWHGDTSAMFVAGEPSHAARQLMVATENALALGITAAKPGGHLGDIGHVISQFAARRGLSVVETYGGHGIGEAFHEAPHVHHVGKAGEGERLQPGMVFTIEPMLNAGRKHVKLLKDGWTVVTKDRKLSAQYEHTIAITDTGSDILTRPLLD